MATTKSQAKVHSVPTSALSKHVSITKPENRHSSPHNYSVKAAEGKISKVFGK